MNVANQKRVAFFVPPAAQRAGGIDLALEGLMAGLRRLGTEVEVDPPIAHLGDYRACHFHGVWQTGHHDVYQECLSQGVPYFVSPHGMLEPWARRHKWWKKWLYFRFREKAHLAAAAGLFATGEMEAGHLRALIPGAAVHSIPLGLDADPGCDYAGARRQLDWDSDEIVLLFLSRIDPKKGLGLLLQAMLAIEPADRERVRLAIVGDGDAGLVNGLKSFCESHRLALPRVDWIGPIWGGEKCPYLQGADLFCLTSYSENFGLAVLEALRVGTPVMTTEATPWSGWRGRDDLIITRSRVPSIAHDLRGFLRDHSPRSDSKREWTRLWTLEEFSWDRLAQKYLDVYLGAGSG